MPPRRIRSPITASGSELGTVAVPTTRSLRRKRPSDKQKNGNSSTENTASALNMLKEKIFKPNEDVLKDVKNKPIRNSSYLEHCDIDEVNSPTRNSSDNDNCTTHKHRRATRFSKRQKVDQLVSEHTVCGTDTTSTETVLEYHDIEGDQFQQALLQTGLQCRLQEPRITVTRPAAVRSKNLMHFFEQYSLGRKCSTHLQQSPSSPVLSIVSELQLHRVASPFDRRVTALEWHPTRPTIVAAASKGGDIILWDTERVEHDQFIQGIGKSGAHLGMKFWPWDLDKVVTSSVDGTVTLHDFEGRHGRTLADTGNVWEDWYCSLDISTSCYIVAAGRTRGWLHLMSTEGRKVFEGRLHKNKITHVEFSPREDWLLCTASVDQTVQLWDVRMLKDRTSALHVLKHEKPVNSAYFSKTDGCRLVTTDQQNEVRVYVGPGWQRERTILHPHRFFQHITPIKATWHPLRDLIVCGRYPDKNFAGHHAMERRTIDVIDANTGRIVTQMQDPTADGISCLNKFNTSGDALASGMGYHVLLWNRKDLIEARHASLMESLTSSLAGSQRSDNSRHARPSNGPGSNRPGTRDKNKRKRIKDTETKKEVKIKVIVKKNSKK